jgi:hypothetical protein
LQVHEESTMLPPLVQHTPAVLEGGHLLLLQSLLDPLVVKLVFCLLLLLLLLLLLQVLDIASGNSLLDQPVENCAGGLTWWGQGSNTLLYTAEVRNTTATATAPAKAAARAAHVVAAARIAAAAAAAASCADG